MLEFAQPILDGGWVMVPLFALGLLIYALGFRIVLVLLPLQARRATHEICAQWMRDPSSAPRRISDVLSYLREGDGSADDIRSRFNEVRASELTRLDANLRVLAILVGAAPLLGLLGTVLGMLTTFDGLAAESSARTTELVADGIRVALITTEMGLLLAIPGTFLVYVARQMRNSFSHLLVRLENIARRSHPTTQPG